jgi:hypothetical protein
MPTSCWGVARRAWLGRQAFEAELDRLAAEGPHRALIARLRCLRGIDTLIALAWSARSATSPASRRPSSS